jgi:hypothetical protein
MRRTIGILYLLRLAQTFLVEEGGRKTVSIRVRSGKPVLRTVKVVDRDEVSYETYPIL